MAEFLRTLNRVTAELSGLATFSCVEGIEDGQESDEGLILVFRALPGQALKGMAKVEPLENELDCQIVIQG